MRGCLVPFAMLVATSCGFGHSVVWPSAGTMIESRGMNRYEWTIARSAAAAPRGPAQHVFDAAPEGSREVGAISARVLMSGWGDEGFRREEEDFYPVLAELAGGLGATHFEIAGVVRGRGAWLTEITAIAILVDESGAPPVPRAYAR